MEVNESVMAEDESLGELDEVDVVAGNEVSSVITLELLDVVVDSRAVLLVVLESKLRLLVVGVVVEV